MAGDDTFQNHQRRRGARSFAQPHVEIDQRVLFDCVQRATMARLGGGMADNTAIEDRFIDSETPAAVGRDCPRRSPSGIDPASGDVWSASRRAIPPALQAARAHREGLVSLASRPAACPAALLSGPGRSVKSARASSNDRIGVITAISNASVRLQHYDEAGCGARGEFKGQAS